MFTGLIETIGIGARHRGRPVPAGTVGALGAIGREHRHQDERAHGRRQHGIGAPAAPPGLGFREFVLHRDRLILAYWPSAWSVSMRWTGCPGMIVEIACL